jgi:cell division septation protein DedD
METEKGRMNQASDRRPAQQGLSEEKLLPPQEGRRGTEWTLVVAGALILALVAFVSGVRMGKGLSDFKHGEPPSLGTQARGQKFFPFRSGVKGIDSQPSREAKSVIPEIPEKRKEKDLPPAQSPGRVVEDKSSPPAEKVAGLEGTKVTPPPKAKFALQVAAFSKPEEAQDLINQLRSKGYSAYQVTGSAAAKGTLYRVRIGQFQSLQEARQFALAFEKKEKVKTIIASLE